MRFNRPHVRYVTRFRYATLRYVTPGYNKSEILGRSDVLTRSLESLVKQESYVL
jgi:hypothetical protein